MAKKFNISLSIGNNITNEKDRTIYVEPPAVEQEFDEHIAQAEAGKVVAKEKFEELKGRVTANETNVQALDAKKADITYVDQELEKKVTAVDGKGLSEENFTAAEKEKLANLENYDDTELVGTLASLDHELSSKATMGELVAMTSDKVTADDLADAVASLRAYIDLLHAENPDANRTQLVEASVNKTPYTVSASDAATDVNIDVPLFDKVNVTAENVNITSNITAEEVAPSGITIKADTVTIGE